VSRCSHASAWWETSRSASSRFVHRRHDRRITSRKRVVHQVLGPRGRGGGCVEASMIAQSVGCSLGCSHSQLGKRVEPLSAGVHSRRAGCPLVWPHKERPRSTEVPPSSSACVTTRRVRAAPLLRREPQRSPLGIQPVLRGAIPGPGSPGGWSDRRPAPLPRTRSPEGGPPGRRGRPACRSARVRRG
jgi:hypothetical protein